MHGLPYDGPGRTAHTFTYFSSRAGRGMGLEMGDEEESNKTNEGPSSDGCGLMSMITSVLCT